MIGSRENSGRFKQGVSGNPSGKTKDGLVPVRDLTAKQETEFALESIGLGSAELSESKREEAARIYYEKLPLLMEEAIRRAFLKGNENLLALLIAPQVPKPNAGNLGPKEIPNKNQLVLDFMNFANDVGLKVNQE
jgi:hypothetical protein